MAGRQAVRKADIDRILQSANKCGLKPVSVDVLPGGGCRFHFVNPADGFGPQLSEAEERAWDAALDR